MKYRFDVLTFASFALLPACSSVRFDGVEMAPRSVLPERAGSNSSRNAADAPSTSASGIAALRASIQATDPAALRTRRDEVRVEARSAKAGRSPANAASQRNTSREAPVTWSPVLAQLLREPVVDSILRAAEEIERGESPGTISMSAKGVSAVAMLLGRGGGGLLDDLLEAVEAQTEFDALNHAKAVDRLTLDRLLIGYIKAWTAGSFVDREGNALDKPVFKGGVSNEAINGLATIVMEAVFDYAYHDLPVFGGTKTQYNITQKYVPAEPHTGAVTLEYERSASVKTVYATKDGAAPTRMSISPKPALRLDAADPGITEGDVKIIRTVSSFAGKQAASLSGAIWETFGSVNVSFVIGADFSVGDNDTLSELVATIFSVSARRISERAAYVLLDEKRSPGQGRSPEPDERIKRLRVLGEE
ncbi:MAG: hypothetical protein JNK25_07450 [Phycisphaerae bacterium]|nr:hypothetical protein [Phycisphaerae bacterium]